MRKKRYHPPGVPPGTLTPLKGAVVPKGIHVIHYTENAVEEVDVARAEDVAPFRQKPGVTWVNVDGLGDVELIAGLGEVFELHPLALEDVLNLPQRPKVDVYDNHLYVVLGILHYEKELMSEQASMFVGRNFVVTFQEDVGDCLDPIRERLRKGTGNLRRLGADYLMHAILDAILDHYFPYLERLGERVEDLEDRVVGSPERGAIAEIHDLKRQLVYLRRCAWPLRDAVDALLRGDSPFVKPPTRLYLRDCYDHVVHILDVIQTCREIASSLVDVYLSSISNRLNQVMKVLTVIATIFMPLTFLAGVYGMNFRHLPEVEWHWGYLAFWLVIVGITLFMLWLFRRKGWLGKGDGP